MADFDTQIRVLLQTAGTEKIQQLEKELDNLEKQLQQDVAAFGSFDAAALKSNAALVQGAGAVASKRDELENFVRSQRHLAEAQGATSRAAIEMSRVFQDFFAGGGFARPADALRAISNNIEGMTLSFKNLADVGLKGVMGSLMGPGGIILGLTALSQINWDWVAKKIGALFDPNAIELFNTHVERLQKKLEDIKNKKIQVEFTGQAKQLEEEVARINAIKERFEEDFKKKQVQTERELGERIEQLMVGKKGERREITERVMGEFGGRVSRKPLEEAEAEFTAIQKRRIEAQKRPEAFEGEFIKLTDAEEAAKKKVMEQRAKYSELLDKQLTAFKEMEDEAVHGVGAKQKAQQKALAKVFEESKVAGAPEIGAQIARGASQTFAKFEERELNSALKEMQAEQTKRATTRHPEMMLQIERELFEKGEGPIVSEEARKAAAARLQPALAKAGEKAPKEAAIEIVERAREDLEKRFAAVGGLAVEKQRPEVQKDLTQALAKSVGAAEEAKLVEAKNKDLLIVAQQEFFKQTQGGIKEVTEEMRESVKLQAQQALIQRGAPRAGAGIAGISIGTEAEKAFLERFAGLGKLPPKEQAEIVRKELEEAPAKGIAQRLEPKAHPAVEAAAERMFFELSKGDVGAITPKVMNAVAGFIEKTLRGLGEKGAAVKVSARELAEKAKEGLGKRFGEFEELPEEQRKARVKEELQDIHEKMIGVEDKGGRARQKQAAALQDIYAPLQAEVEARILSQQDPEAIKEALAQKMITERGAAPAAAQQVSTKIVDEAWIKAAKDVQRFENMGMNTFDAVHTAMNEVLQTMGNMSNKMGQLHGMFMQQAQQARGMRQGTFGRTFSNH